MSSEKKDGDIEEVLKEQEKFKDRPGYTNTEGVTKTKLHPPRVVNFNRLMALTTIAENHADHPKGIAQAYGIKFKRPKKVPLEIVATKDYLHPMDYTNSDTKEVVLVNEIIRMSPESAAYLQETEGAIGESHFLVMPGNTVFLTHRFYVAYSKDNSPIKGAANLGKDKNTGNKLPSRPEPKK